MLFAVLLVCILQRMIRLELQDPYGTDSSDLPLYKVICATQVDLHGLLLSHHSLYHKRKDDEQKSVESDDESSSS